MKLVTFESGQPDSDTRQVLDEQALIFVAWIVENGMV
jgi:hypothetical protein